MQYYWFQDSSFLFCSQTLLFSQEYTNLATNTIITGLYGKLSVVLGSLRFLGGRVVPSRAIPSPFKAKLLYNQGRPVHYGQLFTIIKIQTFQYCPIDFKLCMVLPITVMYDLGSVATLLSLQESLYFSGRQLLCGKHQIFIF